MKAETLFRRILLGLLLVAMPAMAQKPPREVALSYNVKRGDLPIAIVEEDGARYEQTVTRLDMRP